MPIVCIKHKQGLFPIFNTISRTVIDLVKRVMTGSQAYSRIWCCLMSKESIDPHFGAPTSMPVFDAIEPWVCIDKKRVLLRRATRMSTLLRGFFFLERALCAFHFETIERKMSVSWDRLWPHKYLRGPFSNQKAYNPPMVSMLLINFNIFRCRSPKAVCSFLRALRVFDANGWKGALEARCNRTIIKHKTVKETLTLNIMLN